MITVSDVTFLWVISEISVFEELLCTSSIMWSGGKDSSWRIHETISKGFEVSNLFNYVFKESGRPAPYRVSNLLNYVFKEVGTHTV